MVGPRAGRRLAPRSLLMAGPARRHDLEGRIPDGTQSGRGAYKGRLRNPALHRSPFATGFGPEGEIMDCEKFLESYSDYLDRRLEVYPLPEYVRHLRSCRSCEEYDRVMRQGLHLCRQLRPPDTTPDFASDLRSSIHDLQDRLEQREGPSARATAVATLTAAAVLAAAAIPALRGDGGSVQLPPVVVEAPGDVGAPLWGPAPSLAPASNLLLVPNLSAERFPALLSERPSLFRAPLRASSRARPPAESPEGEDRSAE